ncbi:MAG: Holliday junction branch migration protein RuvA [Bacteroidia bacterium]|nr:Holliday junction branch migration protein RuvA [Bacteroidales bacterium]MDD3010718.1 Holliday junction branch migration protein RuvA [Bacteroidales bacterium]NCD42984.1 Holliday junction branch migration protein RuvA [Bacteroidia bacterium]HPE86235.1 Holliday junction branch migration protein RuvA [Bacteroidales bacterium]
MYEYIEGKLTALHPDHAVVETSGIGYFIHITLNTYSAINGLPQCRLLLHFVVREDAQLLFGFDTAEERQLFRLLIAVSGIGANTARLVLSSMSPGEFIAAITHEDVNGLNKIKGIGTKSAQRMIVELKDKVAKIGIASENMVPSHNTSQNEALSALTALGFSKAVAEKAIQRIINTTGERATVEIIVKEALKIL